MRFRDYIFKYALKTEKGKFFCRLCWKWIEHQRWIHFKQLHRNQGKVNTRTTTGKNYRDF